MYRKDEKRRFRWNFVKLLAIRLILLVLAVIKPTLRFMSVAIPIHSKNKNIFTVYWWVIFVGFSIVSQAFLCVIVKIDKYWFVIDSEWGQCLTYYRYSPWRLCIRKLTFFFRCDYRGRGGITAMNSFRVDKLWPTFTSGPSRNTRVPTLKNDHSLLGGCGGGGCQGKSRVKTCRN